MRKPKILLLIITVVFITCLAAISLTACHFTDLDEYVEIKVYTIDDFNTDIPDAQRRPNSFDNVIYYHKTFILQNDIDFLYESLSDFIIESGEIDGNGYTIRNVTTSANGLLPKDSSAKNLTVENVTVIHGESYSIGVMGESGSFDNVTLKNCEIRYEFSAPEHKDVFIGGITGTATSVTNCTVDNLKISAEGYESSKVFYDDIYVGGIAGCGKSFENCTVKNSDIDVKSNHVYCSPYLGGIVGLKESGSIIGCSLVNSSLTATSTRATYHGVVGKYSGTTVNIGGLIGCSLTESGDGISVNRCYTSSNTMTANTTGDAYVAGLTAYGKFSITNCYSSDNKMKTRGYIPQSNFSECYRSMSGLCTQLVGYSSISSCYSANNSFTSDTYSKPLDSSEIVPDTSATSTGLASYPSKSTSFYQCAVYYNTHTEMKYNTFVRSENNVNIDSCYETFPDSDESATLTNSDWYDQDKIKDLLSLYDNAWVFSANSLPKLNLK